MPPRHAFQHPRRAFWDARRCTGVYAVPPSLQSWSEPRPVPMGRPGKQTPVSRFSSPTASGTILCASRGYLPLPMRSLACRSRSVTRLLSGWSQGHGPALSRKLPDPVLRSPGDQEPHGFAKGSFHGTCWAGSLKTTKCPFPWPGRQQSWQTRSEQDQTQSSAKTQSQIETNEQNPAAGGECLSLPSRTQTHPGPPRRTTWPTVLPPGQEKTEAPDEHREPFLARPAGRLKLPHSRRVKAEPGVGWGRCWRNRRTWPSCTGRRTW